MEGQLLVQGLLKSWKERWFVLEGLRSASRLDLLLGCKLKYFEKRDGKLKGELDFSNDELSVRINLSPGERHPHQIVIKVKNKSLAIAAPDASALHGWVRVLEERNRSKAESLNTIKLDSIKRSSSSANVLGRKKNSFPALPTGALPPGWGQSVDEYGEPYYFNVATREVRWRRPFDKPPRQFLAAAHPAAAGRASAKGAGGEADEDDREEINASSRQLLLHTARQESYNAMDDEALRRVATQKMVAVLKGSLARVRVRPLLKQMRHRLRVAQEILSTELKYCQSLEHLAEIVVKPLRWRAQLGVEGANKGTAKLSSGTCVLTLKEINEIFPHITEIYDLSKQLIDMLRPRLAAMEAGDTRVTVGDVFVKLAPFFRLYTEFCASFEKARAHLLQAEKRPLFRKWQQANYEPLVHVRMDSLLITPVQRIPRYVLLLHELRKTTPIGHPDRPHVEEAGEQVGVMAARINTGMGTFDRARAGGEMGDAQAAFGAFVNIYSAETASRRFVRRGALRCSTAAMAAGHCVHVWVYLFTDLLVVADADPSAILEAEPRGRDPSELKYRGHLHLRRHARAATEHEHGSASAPAPAAADIEGPTNTPQSSRLTCHASIVTPQSSRLNRPASSGGTYCTFSFPPHRPGQRRQRTGRE
jgi:hypothetical protein